MFNIEDSKRATNSVVRLISQILPKDAYNYFLPYSGRSIEIVSKNEYDDTRLYIRIIYIGGTRYGVDLSNINLATGMRHRGYFTQIVNKLKTSRSICEIWVSSVLTDEMHQACRKLGFKVADEIQGYKYIIR